MNAAIEKITGDLYSDCFRVFDRAQWEAQGRLLADQLGLKEELVREKKVLDGGCGHGALVRQLANMGAAEVFGVDLKPTPPRGIFEDLTTVRFVQDSLMKLPFENATFDLVVSSGVLHHTTNPSQGFREMVRVLKPGGRLVLGVYGKYGLFPWILWCARLFTVKAPVIPYRFIRWLTDDIFKLDPIWRYQILDYLYVPILRRYTPNQVMDLFYRNDLQNPKRISNIDNDKATHYTNSRTSYSYDYRRLSSRLLFGHGFIVVAGEKPR